MNDDREKTRAQLIDELQRLRRRVAELEESENERRRAEASLAEERNLLRTLIDNLPDYIFIKDAESRFVINNMAHVHVMGATTQEEVVGKTDFDFFPEGLATGYYADEQGVIRSGQPLLDREEFTIDPEGQKQWLLTSKVPLRDSSGSVMGLVGISRDITERKLAEAERERLVLALEYHSTLLQTAVEVSRAVSSILDPNELIQQVVDLARERFNLYYAGLFLIDETGKWAGEPGKWAVLRAGTGEAGRQMLEQGHKLEIGGASMIGWCVANKRARVALDVGEEAVRFENPLLPETRSELALPLICRGRAIGALTIQSTQQAAFNDEDIAVLQTMADQLADAIENARLFYEEQQASLLLDERVKALDCLNDIGRKMEESPSVPEFLQWVTERIPSAMQYPEVCVVAIEFEGEVYGVAEAVRLPRQMVRGLRIGSELVGRVYISYTEEHDFLNEESALLGDIVRRVSGYLETQRLLEEVHHRVNQLETAAEVSRAASSILYLDVLLPQMVELIRRRFDLYYAGILLIDETDLPTPDSPRWAILRAGAGEAGRRTLEAGYKLEVSDSSVIGWCMAHGEAHVILDVESELARFGSPLLPDTRSEMAVPLISRGETIGALTVQSTRSAAFSQEDVTTLQTLADQLANAIQNARLFTETQEAAQRMQALAETSRALSSALDEDTVVRTILESIYWVMDCKYLKVATVDERAGTIEDRHGIWQGEYDAFPEWMPLSRYPLDRPDILADIYRTGRIEIIGEWDERFNGEIWDKFGYEHLLRIFMPIKIRDRVIGVVEVGYDKREKDHIDHKEIQTLAAFVDQAAAALENAHLLRETQQAARQLAGERNLLRTLIDTLPDYIYVKDAESRFVLANIAVARNVGVTSPEELRGKTDFDFNPPELAEKYYALEQGIIHSGQPVFNLEEEGVDQAGNRQWGLTNAIPWRDSQEKIVGLVGITHDITELKRAQEALAEERNLLRTLIDNTPDLIYGMDTEGRFVLANMTIARSVGAASPDELLGKTNFDFHPPEEATQLDATDQRVIQSGQPLINYEEVSIDQAGNQVWTLTNEVPLRDSQGKVVAALGISRDITELKQAEARLERRAVQLQAAAEVARDATTARDLDELLNRAVNLVRDRFGFYHAGIFLVDDQGEYAILTAATGEAGRQMLERGHKLRVGEVGIVGYVTSSGQPRIALDVGADAVHFRNPFLPETRSEMALPLKVGGRVIGALDVQSQEASAFDEDDVRVLQTMADQLAVAIQNVRLLHEMQQTVRELEAAHGRYTREAWRAFVRGGKRPYGYRYRRLGVEPVAEQYPEAREALQQGRPVVTTLQPESQAGPLAAEDNGRNAISSLAVPIKLRGQAIGTLNLRFEDETVPPETVLLVEEVADRLALVLENARLMQEAQNLVLREQQINLVSAQVRSSISMETILQNTVRELGKALGASRTFIQLGTEPSSLPPSDGAATVGDQERDEIRL